MMLVYVISLSFFFGFFQCLYFLKPCHDEEFFKLYSFYFFRITHLSKQEKLNSYTILQVDLTYQISNTQLNNHLKEYFSVELEKV